LAGVSRGSRLPDPVTCDDTPACERPPNGLTARTAGNTVNGPETASDLGASGHAHGSRHRTARKRTRSYDLRTGGRQPPTPSSSGCWTTPRSPRPASSDGPSPSPSPSRRRSAGGAARVRTTVAAVAAEASGPATDVSTPQWSSEVAAPTSGKPVG